jgi:ferredoxin-type protein NapH
MVSMAKSKSRKGKKAPFARWRIWVQLGFLLVWLNPLVQMHTVCGPVFHCYSCPWSWCACPIGILANFSALHTIPFAALGTLLATGAAFGAFVCGWACPFGFLQDVIAKIPTPKFALPLWLGYMRYVVLVAFVLVIPFFWGENSSLFICRLCPAGAIEGALPNTAQQLIARRVQGDDKPQSDGAEKDKVADKEKDGNQDAAKDQAAEKTATAQASIWPSTTKLVILGLFVVAMFFVWRPWCTLLCPLGAIYALLNHVSFVFLRFHQDRCIDCSDCRSLCVDGSPAEQRVDGLHCVRCAECTRCRSVTVETVLSQPKKANDTSAPPSAPAAGSS